MKKIAIFLFHTLLFVLLSILTQVGGAVYLVSLWISKKVPKNLKFNIPIIFTGLYLLTTFLFVPAVAPWAGRERVRHTDKIKPANYLTDLFNRNYVRPELNALLHEAETSLRGTKIKIRYLDANFPFWDGFPLLPHLSHNDGKKIDVAFVYQTPDGKITDKQKSISGYGVFEGPVQDEYNQIRRCLEKGYKHYDFTRYLTLGRINKELVFSTQGTRRLIESFLHSTRTGKIFIEPHLKQRLHLNDPRVRYQGCRSVRHDDHIHIQLK